MPRPVSHSGMRPSGAPAREDPQTATRKETAMSEQLDGAAPTVLGTPDAVYQEIDRVSERAGGAWELPAGYEGSVGRTMFDMPASKDGTLTVLLPKENIDTLPSQALVRIESLADARTYL